ncbi:hypothetical protein HPB51_019115 [Rhipicephalus microplus]|uniref:Uncharacterized protein n=1 Tax=Rhipicephalus microplus TaxID=6941 RepID=A0A9J6EBA5_RHIMP|nr:hypothetical protein HPB51_019115 [Rhipicephalus microplus]
MRTQGVKVLQARMLDDTKTAVITYYGGLGPRFINYHGGEIPCYFYKNNMQVCKVCYYVGHKSDDHLDDRHLSAVHLYLQDLHVRSY